MSRDWQLSIGFVPGFIFGMRSYEETTRINHVFYFLCVDVCLTIYAKRQK